MRMSPLKRLLVRAPIPTAPASPPRPAPRAPPAAPRRRAPPPVSPPAPFPSVPYAPEEILLILVLAGTAALVYSIPIGIAISLLIAIVVSCYRQAIQSYPLGGGAYIVAKDNLGTYAGLIAGAALLIDYVLTVAVSVAAGVAAITSAFPALFDHRIALGVAFIAMITTANLRGIRESGALFAAPTYIFIASFGGMLAYGFTRWRFGWEMSMPPR